MPSQNRSAQRTRAGGAGSTGSGSHDGSAKGPNREAAVSATQRGLVTVRVPFCGHVELPPPQHLAWYLGVGALTVAEVIEWPIALVLVAGKALADNRHNRSLQEFGEALDDAG